MTSPLGYITVLVFGVFQIFGNGISYAAARFEETEIQSPACVVPPSHGLGPFATSSTETHQNHLGLAPLQGRGILEKGASCNGFECAKRVALWVMQKNEVTECLVLRPVWAIMGGLLSPYQCTAGAVTDLARPTVAEPAYFLSRTKPSSKNQAEISQEECQSVLATLRGDPLSEEHQERAQQFILALRPLMEHAYACGTTDDGWQGLWKGFQPFEYAVGLSSPSTSTDACGTACTTWSSVDAADLATSYASDAYNALHAAHGL